jgi:hypothetical protein
VDLPFARGPDDLGHSLHAVGQSDMSTALGLRAQADGALVDPDQRRRARQMGAGREPRGSDRPDEASRKIENHMAAVALNYFAYTFIKIHSTLRTSPAMPAGVTTCLFDVSDLVALLIESESAA